jgi:alpha-L-rhamnosidase
VNRPRSTRALFATAGIGAIILVAACATYLWAKARTLDERRPPIGTNPEDALNRQYVAPGELAARRPLVVEPVEPVAIQKIAEGHYFVEFEKAVFGTIRLDFDSARRDDNVEIHLGERRTRQPRVWRPSDGGVKGGEWIGYFRTKLRIAAGTTSVTVDVPERFRPSPQQLPANLKGIVPFRYAEIVGTNNVIDKPNVRQLAVHYPFDDRASRFASSSRTLDEIWELSKYTIKATSYGGVYVDGNRERKPYEADAYINQLGHYNVDREYGLARNTLAYLLENPTWPTEWVMHAVLMAYADYMYTGDRDFLRTIYPRLKDRTLLSLARGDGLISTQTGLQTPEFLNAIGLRSGKLEDIVDWPASERDSYDLVPADGFIGTTFAYHFERLRSTLAEAMGYAYAARRYRERSAYLRTARYQIVPVNTVVNAFHYQALRRMAELAGALGETADARRYAAGASTVKLAMLSTLFDRSTGLFMDGEGSRHASLHANMFPLAFGLVPESARKRVLEFVKSKGMACSVYGAQYLLEALYAAGESDHAFSLLTSPSERGWANMIHGVGSTITLESWNHEVNPGMDWNHAWGAAPANIIPRWVMGIRPTTPGFRSFVVQPRLGPLTTAEISLPTVRGQIDVSVTKTSDGDVDMNVRIPADATARILVPTPEFRPYAMLVNGRPVAGIRRGHAIDVGRLESGAHEIRARAQ